MFFELRQYKIHSGQIDNWVKYMEEVIIPSEIQRHGHRRQLPRRGRPGDVRLDPRFDSKEQRAQQYEAVYQSEHWTQNIAPRIPEMLDRSGIKVSRILPTETSTRR